MCVCVLQVNHSDNNNSHSELVTQLSVQNLCQLPQQWSLCFLIKICCPKNLNARVCVCVWKGEGAVAIWLFVISCYAFIMNEILYGTTTLCAGVPRCACGYLKMVSAHKFSASSEQHHAPTNTYTHFKVCVCVRRLVWMKSSVPCGNNSGTGSPCCPHRIAFYAFLKWANGHSPCPPYTPFLLLSHSLCLSVSPSLSLSVLSL